MNNFPLEILLRVADFLSPNGLFSLLNVYTGLVLCLLSHHILFKDEEGDNLCHILAREGEVELLRLGLEKGNFSGKDVAARSGRPVERDKQAINSRNNRCFCPLHLAAFHGQTEVVRYLLKRTEVFVMRPDGFYEEYTPLNSAIKAGHEDIVRILLQHGHVKADCPESVARLPLVIAAEYSRESIMRLLLEEHPISRHSRNVAFIMASSKGDTAIMELLFSKGAIDLSFTSRSAYNIPPLHVAAMKGHAAAVRLILEQDPTAVKLCSSNASQNALHCAAEYGKMEVVMLLLEEHGVDVNRLDGSNSTPLNLAIRRGHIDVVRCLLARSDIHANGSGDAYSPLFDAAINGHSEIMKLLLQRHDVDANHQHRVSDDTALIGAIRHQREETVKLLVQHPGVDIEIACLRGYTALMVAIELGNGPITKLLIDRTTTEVLNNRAGRYVFTPLILATLCGHENIVGFLLRRSGIRVDGKHFDGRSLLICAVCSGRVKVVELLLRRDDVDVNGRDQRGDTALTVAMKYGYRNIFRLLLRHPKIMVDEPRSFDMRTPLLMACGKYYIDTGMASCLLQRTDVNVNAADTHGNTPLLAATRSGMVYIVKRLLLHPHIRAGWKNKYGLTALCYAAYHGRKEIIISLLQRGDVSVKSCSLYGFTPLDYAVYGNEEEVVMLMLQNNRVQAYLTEVAGPGAVSLGLHYGIERLKCLLFTSENGKLNSEGHICHPNGVM
ncbi:Ankyrin-2-like protein [Cladobotryum mycophilum]|uniref:Ankyrin-2-like protein n=1 Tax=Cladobotryum mycophilum TaxID=491253 RepID=A0ABR0SRI5_9HYPO